MSSIIYNSTEEYTISEVCNPGNTKQFFTYNPTKNTDIYIPKMKLNTTESTLKATLSCCGIGEVDYCDLVLVKDPTTKQPVHMSAFIKLQTWCPTTIACADFCKLGSIKVFLGLGSKEYWLILPNKNPLPRTHVNVSQLAASTEKLFEQHQTLADQNAMLLDGHKEMDSQLIEMRHMLLIAHRAIDNNRIQNSEQMDIAHNGQLFEFRQMFDSMHSMFDFQRSQINELFKQNLTLEHELEIVQRQLKESYTELRGAIKPDIETNKGVTEQPMSEYLREENALLDQLLSDIDDYDNIKMPTFDQIQTENPARVLESRYYCGNY